MQYISFQGHCHGREAQSTNGGLPHLFAELLRPLEAKGRREGRRASKWRGAHVGRATARLNRGLSTRVEWKRNRSRLIRSWELQ